MDFMVELFFLGMQLSEHSKCEDAYGEDVMYSWLIIQYASLPFPSYVCQCMEILSLACLFPFVGFLFSNVIEFTHAYISIC